MHQLTSIVARGVDGAIGSRNTLPWRVKTDLQFFRRETIDNVVVMGRRTYDSLGGCLPRRSNVVVTHGFGMFPESPDCRAASGIKEALAIVAGITGKKGRAYIVGGATMYEQFATFVDRYLITVIDKKVPDADTFFSEQLLGEKARWTKRVIAEGKANSLGDEADFVIFEYVAKDRDLIAKRRQALVEDVRAWAKRPYRSSVPDEAAALRVG